MPIAFRQSRSTTSQFPAPGLGRIGARSNLQIVDVPADLNVIAEYPIAVIKAAPHPGLARRWVELVKSPAGVAALRQAGFVPCPRK